MPVSSNAILADYPRPLIEAIIARLDSMTKGGPEPTPEQLSTEKGRLDMARAGGQRDIVKRLRAAILTGEERGRQHLRKRAGAAPATGSADS